jgi:peroxiredoxin
MSHLERTANVAIIIACAVVVGHLVYQDLAPSRAKGTYRTGDHISDTPGLKLKSAHLSLILYTSSSCHFCQESLPFYEKLTKAARQAGARVVAVSPEPASENDKFLRAHGVVVDDAVGAAENRIALRGTPSVLLVKRNGTVVDAWYGKIAASMESDVVKRAVTAARS